jgi:hypothetical protein
MSRETVKFSEKDASIDRIQPSEYNEGKIQVDKIPVKRSNNEQSHL